MGDREKPKRQEKKIDPDSLNRLAEANLSAAMAGAIAVLAERPDTHIPFYRMRFDRTSPRHPRDEFAEKSAQKKWRPWEILKI